MSKKTIARRSPRSKVTRTCLNCDCAFLAKPSTVDAGHARFCLHKCAARGRAPNPLLIRPLKRCPKCGKTKPATHEFFYPRPPWGQLCHSHCRDCITTTNIRHGRTVKERFWIHVNKDGPVLVHCPELGSCWTWTASLDRHGYGQFFPSKRGEKKRAVRAHRFSWELRNGPIPRGDGYHGNCLCHRCDNRRCVNPGHMFVGTQTDNINDTVSKARTRHGEARPQAKLRAAQIPVIRRMHAAGAAQGDLARRYGVTQQTISNVVVYRTWRRVG